MTLFGQSSARIESTTLPYSYSTYGIETVHVMEYSNLVVTGGEIGLVDVVQAGRATLSGGTIERLRGQFAPPIPTMPQDKYIQILCKSWNYATGTKRLTGVWGDDSTFSIQLYDRDPWPSGFTFDSINFTIVPEPMTLVLLALGGLLARPYARG